MSNNKTTTRLRYTLGIVCTITAGCASPSQMLVSPQRTTVLCSATGWGYIGALVAHHEYSKCVDQYEAVGFLPIEDAGLVGIEFSPNTFAVIGITPNSPAAAAGIARGDKLIQVNGTPVSDAQSVLKLLFGKAETPVTITIQRNGQTIPYTLIRAHLPEAAALKQ